MNITITKTNNEFNPVMCPIRDKTTNQYFLEILLNENTVIKLTEEEAGRLTDNLIATMFDIDVRKNENLNRTL